MYLGSDCRVRLINLTATLHNVGSSTSHYPIDHYGLRTLFLLLLTANVVPSSPIVVVLMIEAIRSSETSVLTTATRRNIPVDDILHSHRRENLKSYVALTGWAL
jgi:hypothetical protein